MKVNLEESRKSYAPVLPALAIFLLLFILPLLFLLWLSFLTFTPPFSILNVFTLSNYLKFINPYYFGVLVLTFRISIVSTLLALLMSYPVAHYIARGNPLLSKMMVGLLIGLFFTSVVTRAHAWSYVIGQNGLLDNLLKLFGISAINLMYTEPAVIIGTMHFLIPFTTLTLVGPIRSVDPSLEDAARMLGAGEPKVFSKITLPLVLPGIISATMLSLALSLTMFVTPAVLGGGVINMMSNLIYNQTINQLNMPFGAALSVIFLAITMVVITLVTRFLESRVRVKA